MFVVERLDVDETLRVVELINGIVKVSKLKTVLVVFDVNPAA
jgi:ABC-type cobalamin/Fe3+-siderophores transport system ATPase subunit